MLSFTLTAFVELMDHGIVSWDTFSVAFIKKVGLCFTIRARWGEMGSATSIHALVLLVYQIMSKGHEVVFHVMVHSVLDVDAWLITDNWEYS